jgi:TrmH family RNA methyltransferase
MDISKSKISLFSSLKLKKNREKLKLFVAEGNKCVLDTLPYFNLYALVAVKEWLNEHHEITEGVANIYEASHADLKKISSLATPPEVIAIYEIPHKEPDYELITKDITLLLDGIQDPGNLGTIIRLADWFGIRQIFASNDTVDIYNSKTIQATMGSISRVNLFYTSLTELISKFPNIPSCGLLLDGDNIYQASLPDVAFVIMGNEGKGLTQEIRNIVSNKLLIPSYPIGEETGESLNVATATAITLAEFRRKKFMKNG